MTGETKSTGEPESISEPGSAVSPRWVTWRRSVDLGDYDRRWDAMVERGESVHGEVDFIERLLGGEKADILDAGCGTGRLAIEATRRGHSCVGVDLDHDMIERARAKAPEIMWLHADLSQLEIELTFDVVVMAGNIPLFCAPGSQAAIIHSLTSHLRIGGMLICGFSIEDRNGSYTATDFDRDAKAAGLHRRGWYRTWDAEPLTDDVDGDVVDGDVAAGDVADGDVVAGDRTKSDLGDYAVLVYQR